MIKLLLLCLFAQLNAVIPSTSLQGVCGAAAFARLEQLIPPTSPVRDVSGDLSLQQLILPRTQLHVHPRLLEVLGQTREHSLSEGFVGDAILFYSADSGAVSIEVQDYEYEGFVGFELQSHLLRTENYVPLSLNNPFVHVTDRAVTEGVLGKNWIPNGLYSLGNILPPNLTEDELRVGLTAARFGPKDLLCLAILKSRFSGQRWWRFLNPEDG